MLIREATISDAMGIAQVMHTIDEIKVAIGDTLDETCTRVERAISTAITTGASTILVGITSEGLIVAYCAVHWVPFVFLSGPEAYISELFLRPDVRGSGLGAALLKEVRSRAALRGCSRISLLNHRERESYQRCFYAKQGFQEREQMANFILPMTTPNNASSMKDRRS
ncbi:MAG: GNAT family N-acetyltransferase [Puniceicoccales bacterium]|jgi:GNAT superfamily N-acetyltransferase|nr:GNAT family N-acetyltransferase [Puniceicoccales bacterium]